MRYITVTLVLLTVSTTSCFKKYSCNCTSYKKGTTEVVNKMDNGFRGKTDDAEWKRACEDNTYKIDSANNYTTTTDCVAR